VGSVGDLFEALCTRVPFSLFDVKVTINFSSSEWLWRVLVTVFGGRCVLGCLRQNDIRISYGYTTFVV